MTYNAWIKHYQYVCTMPICPPHRMTSFKWPHQKNRGWYIYHSHSNTSFFSITCTNTWLGHLICTCRVWVLGHTYIDSITLWNQINFVRIFWHNIISQVKYHFSPYIPIMKKYSNGPLQSPFIHGKINVNHYLPTVYWMVLHISPLCQYCRLLPHH